MKAEITIPVEIASRLEYKRKFSFLELYNALTYVPGAISRLKANNKSKLLEKDFLERLQLAVTEVNGCPACSYQHTKMALKLGMSNKEISTFLSGGNEHVKPEDAKAIVFAQHFADARGIPKKYAYDSIVEEYGKQKAEIILSAVQVMITGNIYGIPFSAFQSRMKGKKYKDSSLFYEVGMLIGGVFILPIALIHGLLKLFFVKTNARFDLAEIEE